MAAFVAANEKYAGTLRIPGIEEPFEVTAELLREVADTYLGAVKLAGEIYRHIEGALGGRRFVTEVSTDEASEAQTPVELFFILGGLAREGVPVQTIAPKFTGRFNKGVDYVGDVELFTQEFEQDVAVIGLAVREFSLPTGLKLSVHSGSDKFSIYGPINRIIKQYDAGLHVKTAGTTWLEELIGLAEAGGDGLALAKEVYAAALGRQEELCGPYATVIDIDAGELPSVLTVDAWDGERFARTLRHDQSCPFYNRHFRQLLHVGYKIAAEMGARYLDMLERYKASVAKNVTENIYERHLRRFFLA